LVALAYIHTSFIPHQHGQPPYPRVSWLHIILNGEGAPHVHLLRSIGPGQLQRRFRTWSKALTEREFVREPYTDAQRSCHVEGNPADHWKFTTRRGATKHSFLSARSSKAPPSTTDTKQKQEIWSCHHMGAQPNLNDHTRKHSTTNCDDKTASPPLGKKIRCGEGGKVRFFFQCEEIGCGRLLFAEPLVGVEPPRVACLFLDHPFLLSRSPFDQSG